MTSFVDMIPIPALKDNYIWVIKNQNQQAIIIDPGDAEPVLKFLKEWDLNLLAILVTHHHGDHVNGIGGILEHYKVPVYDFHSLKGLDQLIIDPFVCDILKIPGHTLDHIAFYFKQQNALFTGDTLFCAGCGRVFEGTMEQMYSSLMKIASLPNDTKIYCGHEYTLSNLTFAELAESTNKDIKNRLNRVKMLREKNIPTVPSLLRDEKNTNPFLRCTLLTIKAELEKQTNQVLTSPIQVFEALRKWKDHF